MSDMRDSAILCHVYVQPVFDEILSHHLARLNDAVLLWKFSLGKELTVASQSASCLQWLIKSQGCLGELTVSLDSSPSCNFLPVSLFLHSSVLSPDWVVTPGTTRGILRDGC